MKVYDVFPFFNELDLLEIRLNVLDQFVDEFIIVEANTTFSGLPKEYFASEAMHNLKKFAHKITIFRISHTPRDLNAFEAEHFQRDAVRQLLETKLSPDDILIYGDVDEIPDPDLFESAIHKLNSSKKKIGHFAQDMFYYYLNNKETSGTLLSYTGEYKWVWSRKWLGTSISKWEYACNFSLTNMRHPSRKTDGWRIKNGGWHFSFIGGEAEMDVNTRAKKKIQSYGHQEFNNEVYLSQIPTQISSSQDLFNRKRCKFSVLKNYDFLPKYILDNLDRYKYLIKEN